MEKNANKTYAPIIAITSVSILLTLVTTFDFMTFMGFFLTLLACQKLIDIKSFVKSFKKYDLVTKKVNLYGYIYPFLELAFGLAMIGNLYLFPTGVLMFIVGLIGSISVFKSVYLDKLDFNCACVGGNQNVPLGFVSFTENISMTVMGLYLILT